MPYCPNCKSEYLEGIKMCPDCEETLVSELEEAEHFSGDDFSLLYTCNYEYEAELIKNALESGGIEAHILIQKDSSFPVPGNLGTIKIFVRNDDFSSAKEYMQNANLNLSEEDLDRE